MADIAEGAGRTQALSGSFGFAADKQVARTAVEVAHMRKVLQSWLRNEDGAVMVEYAIVLSLIAVVCILIVQAIGQKAGRYYERTNEGFR